jgi:thymidine phosphorylase
MNENQAIMFNGKNYEQIKEMITSKKGLRVIDNRDYLRVTNNNQEAFTVNDKDWVFVNENDLVAVVASVDIF